MRHDGLSSVGRALLSNTRSTFWGSSSREERRTRFLLPSEPGAVAKVGLCPYQPPLAAPAGVPVHAHLAALGAAIPTRIFVDEVVLGRPQVALRPERTAPGQRRANLVASASCSVGTGQARGRVPEVEACRYGPKGGTD